MSLAAIFGVCLLLVSPSANGLVAGRVGTLSQETPPAQDSAKAAQEPQSEQPPASAAAPDSTPQPVSPQPPAKVPAPKPSPSTAKKTVKSSQKPKAAPDGTPSKVVVRDGSTAEPTVQLSPGVTKQQASQQIQSTDQLLESADASVKKMSGQQLKPGQQEMVNQIHRYTAQAKAATTAGDLDRAHNFALKARLLADELVKQGGK